MELSAPQWMCSWATWAECGFNFTDYIEKCFCIIAQFVFNFTLNYLTQTITIISRRTVAVYPMPGNVKVKVSLKENLMALSLFSLVAVKLSDTSEGSYGSGTLDI